jgi:ParB family chromosome partitioning protein
MAQARLALKAPETIPLTKLVIHDGNVRQVKAGLSIETLAADIARRGLLQSLSVRPILDDQGRATGEYGVQAGGRRLRALQLLVKQKKLAKDAPIPCIVQRDGFAEADSLAENTEREALHPLDQYRAFAALKAKGQGDETIAAAFGVTAAVVKQRLMLANASPVLLKAFEDEEINLDQLKAFCLTDNHARQEQVWESIQKQWNKDARVIRRMLTETTVSADDRRALFVGVEAYKAAGGLVIRDLFEEDGGGYFQDAALLGRLVEEKLQAEADRLRSEGWKWVEAALEFPWNHTRGYQPLVPSAPALDDKEQHEYDLLDEELAQLTEYSDYDLTFEERQRRDSLSARFDELENRVAQFDPAMKRKGGVFVSVRQNGKLFIDPGYIHHSDMEKAAASHHGAASAAAAEQIDPETGEITTCATSHAEDEPPSPEDLGPAIPERLKTELTAYRTLALREALAQDPGIAFLAVLHALVLKSFYSYGNDRSSLQIQASDWLVPSFAGLADCPDARKIDARHKSWDSALPKKPDTLWAWLGSLDQDNRQSLFAHCAALTVNGVHESHVSCGPRIAHADELACALALDMTQAGWVTGASNYLGRITKAGILDAVREAKGEETAELIAHLKKKDMAAEAERLIAGTNWLPEPLRTPRLADDTAETALPAFLDDEIHEVAA